MTGYLDKGKRIRREQFLAEMEKVVPWARVYALIEPYYPKGSPSGGRPPLPLERMFRIYCLQQWYNLSDLGTEEALYDSITMRQFAGVCTDGDVIPDETSILNFRRLLEKHKLTERLLTQINAHLCERGLLLGKGTHRRCEHHQHAFFDEEPVIQSFPKVADCSFAHLNTPPTEQKTQTTPRGL